MSSNNPIKNFSGNNISKAINQKHLPDEPVSSKESAKYGKVTHTDKYPHKEGRFYSKQDGEVK